MWSTSIALAASIITITSAAPLDGQRQPNHLAKRAEPPFKGWDDAPAEERAALQVALQDTYQLASYAQFLWEFYPDILDKYFPPEDLDGVKQVFNNIVPDYLTAATTPGPIIGDFEIVGTDWLAGLGDDDLCARGFEGYARNVEKFSPPTRRWADAHFCPAAFYNYETEIGPAPLLTDLDCSTFDLFGEYRMDRSMESLGSVILHEMMHFNRIGESVFGDNLPEPDNGGAFITDLDRGYGPSNALRIRRDTPDLAKRNADNYNFAALEIYWTGVCEEELKGQNGRFGNPIE
ncbi:hypothetical protein H2201_004595 [Coniosporium apollinis]|uniref:Lysine-specific metallo-endopeptidase domain-containing protein n=1 Tax=Coniosporium apollinis TaxID=61459 RepID=A0ABQ9NXJ3_9PEZI|nr:hypothetical protein H2201_004595 [Coniosporium apollinis]